jgi:hypothetical protein
MALQTTRSGPIRVTAAPDELVWEVVPILGRVCRAAGGLVPILKFCLVRLEHAFGTAQRVRSGTAVTGAPG